ncbi:MAG: hypothetical protein JSU96_06085 [Acidobacteriota bacterium]|nr:MAG: hypothetical protein JSU96_06085 [Acidobacteriota bacterium]
MTHSAVNNHSPKREVLFDEIVRVLDEMPEELREAFILNHYLGRTPEQIAAQTGSQRKDLDARLEVANRIFFRSLRLLR